MSIKIGLMEPIQRWEGHYHPIGLLYISSYLEKAGYNNFVINKKNTEDSTGCDLETRVIKKITELSLDIIGISCAANEFAYVESLCRKIKDSVEGIKIVVGGPMPTSIPEIFCRDEVFDFVARGEGESILLNLIQRLDNAEEPFNVLGISYREKGGRIVHNPPAPLIKNIDSIPYPAYEKVNMEQYVSMHDWVIRGFPIRGIYVVTSRGCPFSCIYCGAALIHGKKVRYRSPENVYGELKFLKEVYNIEGVFFCDDTLLLNKEHVRGICSIMKELNLVWSCFSRVDTLHEELLPIMKKSGCLQIDFGVESGSDRVLKLIKKTTSVLQAKKAFRLCKKYKIRTFANLMMGLPSETKDEINATAELAKQLDADTYVLSLAMPLPGTEFWDMINPDIKPEEFNRLGWNGENYEMTDRVNNSNVPTGELIGLYNSVYKKLRKQSLMKKVVHIKLYCEQFMKLDNKVERIKYEIFTILTRFAVIRRIYFSNPFIRRSYLSIKKILKTQNE